MPVQRNTESKKFFTKNKSDHRANQGTYDLKFCQRYQVKFFILQKNGKYESEKHTLPRKIAPENTLEIEICLLNIIELKKGKKANIGEREDAQQRRKSVNFQENRDRLCQPKKRQNGKRSNQQIDKK